MKSKIVLASASKYRAASLRRLGLDFSQHPSAIDESPRISETPASLAARLAHEKAQSLVATHSNSIIIGCDQTGSCNGQLLHKPLSIEAAQDQLAQMSGQQAIFYTAMTVIHVVSGRVETLTHDLDTTQLQLRALSREQIAAYIAQDNPIDCAGSFKIESLGIILFNAVKTSDPSALEGISLIQLTSRLLDLGVRLGFA
ncbi:MAG: septum formation protein Maf [Gammaproteobacteria bacterium]|nr:septum formation protein Maf [Gammaproteobacteria bacterium]